MMITAINGEPIKGMENWTPKFPGEYVEGNTRAMSQEKVDHEMRERQVLEVLGGRLMTAKEIAIEMHRRGMAYSDERNVSAPSLTRLRNRGLVAAVGKKLDHTTGRKVTIYRRLI